ALDVARAGGALDPGGVPYVGRAGGAPAAAGAGAAALGWALRRAGAPAVGVRLASVLHAVAAARRLAQTAAADAALAVGLVGAGLAVVTQSGAAAAAVHGGLGAVLDAVVAARRLADVARADPAPAVPC